MSTRQKINKITTNHARENISLDGAWGFKLDQQDVGKKQRWFKKNNLHWDKIEVPGCWQAQGFGYKKGQGRSWEDPFEGRKLKAEYTGPAWYKRDFVLSDKIADRKIFLKIGGIHPAGEIWINEKFTGSHADSFISYKVNITDCVFSGNNKLAIRVYEKNRFLSGIFDWCSKWSGIYGRVNLEITSKLLIEDVFIKPDLKNNCADIEISISNCTEEQREIEIICAAKTEGKEGVSASKKVVTRSGRCSFKINLQISEPSLWSPEEPNLYNLEVILKIKDEVVDKINEKFGMREFGVSGRKLYLNGEHLFLKAYGDDMIFPKTVCPTTDKEYYRNAFKTAKSYGFNCVSLYWPPTVEFFEVADEVGMLVQVGVHLIHGALKHDKKVFYYYDFNLNHPVYLLIKKSFTNLILQKKNHPSVMSYMISAEGGVRSPSLINCYNDLYDTAKKLDPTRLILSNDGSDFWGGPDEKTDLVSQFAVPVMLKMHVPTGTERERFGFAKLLKSAKKKPYLLHEYGYISSYPNIKLKKYYNEGALPYWLNIAENAAKKKGLYSLLTKFVENSEKLQRIIRKLAIEETRKMPDLTGFILWLFQDTYWAVEGVVNDFYGRKNVGPSEFLQSNGTTVLLINRDKPVLRWGDTLKADLLISHHGSDKIENAKLNWKFHGKDIKFEGIEECKVDGYINGGLISRINIKLPDKTEPAKMAFEAKLEKNGKTITRNSWDYWIFPDDKVKFNKNVYVLMPHYFLRNWLEVKSHFPDLKGISIIDSFARYADCSLVVSNVINKDVLNFLIKGGKVLLIPNRKTMGSEGFLPELSACYRTVYWNDPGDIWGTLGTIIENHPALGNFPHEGWCDFQFRSLFEDVGAINLDAFPVKIEPIIRIIDNYRLCRTRTHLVEFRVGKGKVLATSFNFRDKLGILPEANYLFSQFINYCLSNKFNPKNSIMPGLLWKILEKQPFINE